MWDLHLKLWKIKIRIWDIMEDAQSYFPVTLSLTAYFNGILKW